MRYLKSRDLTQLFKVEDYFFDAYWYVNESEHKWGYLQKKDKGDGKRELKGKFKGLHAYDSELHIKFQTNFNNYYHAEISEIERNINEPTYCNHATAVYLKELGLDYLAEYFKNHDANECFDYLMDCSNTSGSKVIKVNKPITYASYNSTSITIAIQKGDIIPGKFDKNGKQLYQIGHVAPVIGKGSDGKIYIANKGSLPLDGVVDIETGFGVGLDKISFFEVYR